MARVLIGISGGPGTGTTTLSKLLSARLGLPHVYAGQIFRAMAAEHGMSLSDFGHHAEKHPEIDRELDDRLVRIAREGDCILEGRMVVWQIEHAGVPALKVLLTAPERVRAERVANRENKTNVEAVLAENRDREASEAKRYHEIYGFEPNDPSKYDLVIDTSDKTPEHIADLVLMEAAGRFPGLTA